MLLEVKIVLRLFEVFCYSSYLESETAIL